MFARDPIKKPFQTFNLFNRVAPFKSLVIRQWTPRSKLTGYQNTSDENLSQRRHPRMF